MQSSYWWEKEQEERRRREKEKKEGRDSKFYFPVNSTIIEGIIELEKSPFGNHLTITDSNKSQQK